MPTRAPHGPERPRLRHQPAGSTRRPVTKAEALLRLVEQTGDDAVRRRRDVLAWASAQEDVDEVVDAVLGARRAVLDQGGPAAVADDLDALLGPAVRAVTDRVVRTALTDPLTGLGTRRAFVEAIPGVLAEADASGDPVLVVLADIDGLKRINDTGGHAAGDRVLRRFADSVTATLRADDAAYRLGGDEIVIVLPGAAAGSVETLQHRLATAGAPAASLGWAVYPAQGRDAAALLDVADGRLYAAKRARRRAGGAIGRRPAGTVSRAASVAALTLAVAGGAVAAHTLAPAGSAHPQATASRPAPATTLPPTASAPPAAERAGPAALAGRHGRPAPRLTDPTVPSSPLASSAGPRAVVPLPSLPTPQVAVPPVVPPPATPIQAAVAAVGHVVGDVVCLLGCAR